LEANWKIFHFQEMNWLIFFPTRGNEGRKYLYYSVEFSDLSKGAARKRVCLADVLENPLFEENYPHTVGFFKGSEIEKIELGSAYLEIRIIRSIEEFLSFLNYLDI